MKTSINNAVGLLAECLHNGDKGISQLQGWFLGERSLIERTIEDLKEAETQPIIEPDRKMEDAYKKRWGFIKADPDGARALLLLLKEGKGTPDDFDTMVDRIIESRSKDSIMKGR